MKINLNNTSLNENLLVSSKRIIITGIELRIGYRDEFGDRQFV